MKFDYTGKSTSSLSKIYRSLNQDREGFDSFTINFDLMLSKIHAENPFCTTITDDFNWRLTHEIVYGELSISNISFPPYAHRVWYCDTTDFVAIRKSIEMFALCEHLDNVTCLN